MRPQEPASLALLGTALILVRFVRTARAEPASPASGDSAERRAVTVKEITASRFRSAR